MFHPTASLAQFNSMPFLHYGTDSSVQLEFADGVAPEFAARRAASRWRIRRPR